MASECKESLIEINMVYIFDFVKIAEHKFFVYIINSKNKF